VFLNGSKESEIAGLHIANRTCAWLRRHDTRGGGGVGTILPTPPASCSLWDFYEPPGWEAICSKRQRRTRCHLLAADNDFLYARILVLVPRWHKCLNINGDYVELWCVPSATRCPYMHQDRIFCFIFWNTFIQSKMECTFPLLCHCVIFMPAFIGQYRAFPDSSLVINMRFHLMLQNHVVVVAVRLALRSQVSC